MVIYVHAVKQEMLKENNCTGVQLSNSKFKML